MKNTLGQLLAEKFLQDTPIKCSPLCRTCTRVNLCATDVAAERLAENFHRCPLYNNGLLMCSTCIEKYCISCRFGDQYAE